MRRSGAALLAALALHALELRAYGETEDLLWVCNLACAALAAGLVVRSPRLVTGGTLALVVGTPLWLFGIATAARPMITSVPVHVGGIAAGLHAMRTLGVPPGTWGWTLLAHGATLPLARACTSPARNVNLAFAIWPGFEPYFPSHAVYLVLVAAAIGASYALLEAALRRALRN